MTTLFISDLHLSEQEPNGWLLLQKFLTEYAKGAEALYILGDLFELWIGDDDVNEFHQKIIAALKNLSQTGTRLFLMQGNRDFLLGSTFCQQIGAQLLHDPSAIDLYGTPTLLTHGDLLCTDDQRYQRWRIKAHNPALQKIFLGLPLAWRRSIARYLRQSSQHYQSNLLAKYLDINLQALYTLIQNHRATLLIHGHTHRPTIHYFKLEGRWICHTVLSDWHQYGNVLLCTPDGRRQLMSFSGFK